MAGPPELPEDPRDHEHLKALGIFLLLVALLNFLSARNLARRQKKTFSIVVAAINCLSLPLGTILGVFTIVVLSRPSVEASYQRNR